MDKAIARLNIEHFTRLLAVEKDQSRRAMLERLLAEEQAKLALLERHLGGDEAPPRARPK